jgi:hypothetical protein
MIYPHLSCHDGIRNIHDVCHEITLAEHSPAIERVESNLKEIFPVLKKIISSGYACMDCMVWG